MKDSRRFECAQFEDLVNEISQKVHKCTYLKHIEAPQGLEHYHGFLVFYNSEDHTHTHDFQVPGIAQEITLHDFHKEVREKYEALKLLAP